MNTASMTVYQPRDMFSPLQILRLIRAHPNRNDLVVRLAFSLGNFAAADDQCR